MPPVTRAGAARRRSDLRKTVAIKQVARNDDLRERMRVHREHVRQRPSERLYMEQALAAMPHMYSLHFPGMRDPPARSQLEAWLEPFEPPYVPGTAGAPTDDREAIFRLAQEMRSSARQRKARSVRRPRRGRTAKPRRRR